MTNEKGTLLVDGETKNKGCNQSEILGQKEPFSLFFRAKLEWVDLILGSNSWDAHKPIFFDCQAHKAMCQ